MSFLFSVPRNSSFAFGFLWRKPVIIENIPQCGLLGLLMTRFRLLSPGQKALWYWMTSIRLCAFWSPGQRVVRFLHSLRSYRFLLVTNKPSVGQYALAFKGLGQTALMEEAAEGSGENWLESLLCHSLAVWSWASYLTSQIYLFSSVKWDNTVFFGP